MKPTYFIHCGEDGKYKVTKELVSDPITLFSKRNGLYVAENINLLEVACLIVCLYDQTPLKTSSNINFFAIGSKLQIEPLRPLFNLTRYINALRNNLLDYNMRLSDLESTISCLSVLVDETTGRITSRYWNKFLAN